MFRTWHTCLLVEPAKVAILFVIPTAAFFGAWYRRRTHCPVVRQALAFLQVRVRIFLGTCAVLSKKSYDLLICPIFNYPQDPCMLYMVTFAVNIPPMLAYIPYMDPMGQEVCCLMLSPMFNVSYWLVEAIRAPAGVFASRLSCVEIWELQDHKVVHR